MLQNSNLKTIFHEIQFLAPYFTKYGLWSYTFYIGFCENGSKQIADFWENTGVQIDFLFTSFLKVQSNILTRSCISKLSRLSEIAPQNVAVFGSGPFSKEPCRAREARKFLEIFFCANWVQNMAWLSLVSIIVLKKVRIQFWKTLNDENNNNNNVGPIEFLKNFWNSTIQKWRHILITIPGKIKDKRKN